MSEEFPKALQQHFVAHPRVWGWALLIGWFGSNALVLATTKLMEIQREGRRIAFWEPLSWELSSAAVILLLLPLGIYLHDRWLAKLSPAAFVVAHLVLTLPFSLAHVFGMVSIRSLCYSLMDSAYDFGDLSVELLYEYRKDAQTYLTLLLLVFGFRLLHRRMQGEASYLQVEQPIEPPIEPNKSPDILLIKKLGREFLVKVADIEWIEASGNYANLHLRGNIYPMRITMDKLEKLLPPEFARIHRSSIVNLHAVQQIQTLDAGDYEVTLKGGKTLTLSRRYRDAFKSTLSIE